MDPADVIWIGGLPHEARSTIAREVAEQRGLRLYSLPVPELPATVRELARTSVRRFRDLLEEIRGLDESGLVVEGIQLFPTSVAAVLTSSEHALFVLPAEADTELARAIARDVHDLRLRSVIASDEAGTSP